jgi:mRNA interferase HigB
VHVISRKPLREFWSRHHDARTLLSTWFKAITHCSARNLTELKQTFGSVDYVSTAKGDFHVFNIGGNKYRVIATVHFNPQKVFVRHVLTHVEYAAGKWK